MKYITPKQKLVFRIITTVLVVAVRQIVGPVGMGAAAYDMVVLAAIWL